MQADDWRGEHYIRGVRVSPEQRHLDNLSLASRWGHFKRQQKGTNMSRSASPFAQMVNNGFRRKKGKAT